MKVFDVSIGDVTILRDMDPFVSAGSKLLPGDEFIDLQVRGGQLYADNMAVGSSAIHKDKFEIKFRRGKADNPKVNAIMLVRGGLDNTHYGTYNAYKEAMLQIQREKEEARAKAEQFFAEDAYDYEERVDGRGPFNQFLKHDWALEASVAIFLVIFFRVVMPHNSTSNTETSSGNVSSKETETN